MAFGVRGWTGPIVILAILLATAAVTRTIARMASAPVHPRTPNATAASANARMSFVVGLSDW